MLENHWDFYHSLYFACTILSTIGYGNFPPMTDSSKLLLTIMCIPGRAFHSSELSTRTVCVPHTIDSEDSRTQ
jgi:hypothetical protein